MDKEAVAVKNQIGLLPTVRFRCINICILLEEAWPDFVKQTSASIIKTTSLLNAVLENEPPETSEESFTGLPPGMDEDVDESLYLVEDDSLPDHHLNMSSLFSNKDIFPDPVYAPVFSSLSASSSSSSSSSSSAWRPSSPQRPSSQSFVDDNDPPQRMSPPSQLPLSRQRKKKVLSSLKRTRSSGSTSSDSSQRSIETSMQIARERSSLDVDMSDGGERIEEERLDPRPSSSSKARYRQTTLRRPATPVVDTDDLEDDPQSDDSSRIGSFDLEEDISLPQGGQPEQSQASSIFRTRADNSRPIRKSVRLPSVLYLQF